MISSRARFSAAIALLFILGTAPARAAQVVVIDIDADTEKPESAGGLGPFGGSYRAHHARLIEALARQHVKGIAFAMSFAENPDAKDGSGKFASAAAKAATEGTYTAITKNGATDAALTALLDGHGRYFPTDVMPGYLCVQAISEDHFWFGLELLIRAKELRVSQVQAAFEKTVSIENRAWTVLCARRGNIGAIKKVSYRSVVRQGFNDPDLAGAYVVVGNVAKSAKIPPGADLSETEAAALMLEGMLKGIPAAGAGPQVTPQPYKAPKVVLPPADISW